MNMGREKPSRTSPSGGDAVAIERWYELAISTTSNYYATPC